MEVSEFLQFSRLTSCTHPLPTPGQFAVIPIILNKYFGDKHYGTNLGMQSTPHSEKAGRLGLGHVKFDLNSTQLN